MHAHAHARTTRTTAICSAWVAACIAAPSVHAQARSAGQDLIGLEEIVVTATRRAESVGDVPYNIQALPGETLDLLGATAQKDFVRLIPGLSFVDGGARDGMEFVLRGLTTGGTLNGALGQTTTTYVDDTQVDLYTGLLDLALLDVDRVEVLRGPQGTLYGGGAIGGTIRYISERPNLAQPEARVGAQLSSTEQGGLNYAAQGLVNAPVVQDKLALRANLGYFDNEGYIDNVRLGTDDVNHDRKFSGRLALRAQPTDALNVDFTYYLQQSRYGEYSYSMSDLEPLAVNYYRPGGARTTVHLGNLTVSYDLGFAELTSSSSYTRERLNAQSDETHYIRDQVFASYIPVEAISELTVFTPLRMRSRTLSEEIRLVSKDTQRIEWLAGLYWFDRESRRKAQEMVARPFPGQDEFDAALAEVGRAVPDQ